jgi:osmotically-inducible protein OsmY
LFFVFGNLTGHIKDNLGDDGVDGTKILAVTQDKYVKLIGPVQDEL